MPEPATTTADAAAPGVAAAARLTILSRGERRHHQWMIGIAFAVVILAMVFDVRPDQRVFVRGFPKLVMPGTCMSREILHVDCPGCGLTRSIIFLAHGEWYASWHMHRVGGVMAFMILAQVPYRFACLRKNRPALGTLFPKIIAYTLIGLLFGNWILGRF